MHAAARFDGRTAATVALVLAVLLVLLWPRAFGGGEVLCAADLLLEHEPWAEAAPDGFVAGNPSLSDQASQFLPWSLYALERGADGELPWWNPRAGCGEPFVANLQSGVFSPFAPLLRLLPWSVGLLAIACAKVLLAGVFTALFLRLLGASRVAATFGAVAFALGGFQFLWLSHPHSAVSAFLPALMYLAERWVRGPGRLTPVAFALATAAMLLAGHVETSLHVAFAVGLWTLARLVQHPELPPARAARRLAAMTGAALVGLALAGVQLVPFVEYLLASTSWAERRAFHALWRQAPWDEGQRLLLLAGVVVGAFLLGRAALRAVERRRGGVAALGWLAAVVLGAWGLALARRLGFSELHLLLFDPDLFGHPVPGRGALYAGPRAYVDANGAYVGWVCLPLALLAAVAARGARPAVRALGALWAVAFVVAYDVPVLGYLVHQLPLFSASLNNRLVLVVGFATATLAALGLDALRDRDRAAARFALVAGALAGVLALAPRLLADAPPEAPVSPPAEGVGAPPVAPTPGPPLGSVAPLPDPHRGRAPLPVVGWALDDGGAPTVVLELIQGVPGEEAATVTTTRLGPDRFGPPTWSPPRTFSRYPGADRCGFVAELDLSEFEPGRVWLRVTLDDGAGGVAVIYDQSFRWLPGAPVAPRWWLLGAASVGLVGWAARRRERAGAAALVALALLAVDLHLFGRGFHPTAPPEHVYPEVPVTDFLVAQPGRFRVFSPEQALLMPNTAGVYGLEDARRYDAVDVDGYTLFLEALRPAGADAFAVRTRIDVAHPAFPMLGVRYVLARRGYAPPPGVPLEPVFASGGTVVFADGRFDGRAFLVPTARSIGAYLEALPPADASADARRAHVNVAAALGAWLRAGLDWRQTLVVEGDAAPPMPTDLAALPPPAPGPVGTVREVSWEAERIELHVSAERDAWLLVCETHFPGWVATLDGAPAPVERAFFAFRAVAVPAGESRVVMRYAPLGARVGAGLSGLGVLGLLALALAGRRRAPSASG